MAYPVELSPGVTAEQLESAITLTHSPCSKDVLLLTPVVRVAAVVGVVVEDEDGVPFMFVMILGIGGAVGRTVLKPGGIGCAGVIVVPDELADVLLDDCNAAPATCGSTTPNVLLDDCTVSDPFFASAPATTGNAADDVLDVPTAQAPPLL